MQCPDCQAPLGPAIGARKESELLITWSVGGGGCVSCYWLREGKGRQDPQSLVSMGAGAQSMGCQGRQGVAGAGR